MNRNTTISMPQECMRKRFKGCWRHLLFRWMVMVGGKCFNRRQPC